MERQAVGGELKGLSQLCIFDSGRGSAGSGGAPAPWPPAPPGGWARVDPMGERALLLRWDSGMDRAANRSIQRLARALVDRARQDSRLVAVVPGFDTLLVEFDPDAAAPEEVLGVVRWAAWSGVRGAPPQRIEIPVCYGGVWGPDLNAVARRIGLSPETVVRLHASRPYHVYCLGFQAGFPYAGPLPDALVLPRRDHPAPRVAGGAVAVAGRQTGVYTRPGPGGWHVIGATPWNLFQPHRERPTLYQPGDELWFRPVSAHRFQELAESGAPA